MIKKGKTELIGIRFSLENGSTQDVYLVPGKLKDEIEQYLNKNEMTNNEMLADRVLIKSAEAETKTASGIYIPDSAKEKPMKGEVVLVGPGTKDIDMVVKPGDEVLFGKYSGIDIDLPEGKFLMMKQDDIFMVTNKKQL